MCCIYCLQFSKFKNHVSYHIIYYIRKVGPKNCGYTMWLSLFFFFFDKIIIFTLIIIVLIDIEVVFQIFDVCSMITALFIRPRCQLTFNIGRS